MAGDPDWWRGLSPLDDRLPSANALSGEVSQSDVDAVQLDPETGLRIINLDLAKAENLRIDLTDVYWSAAWSDVAGCHFLQRRTRRVSNPQGFAGHGDLGWRPSRFRDCTFEGVRFKTFPRPGPPGFTLGQGRFENCSFIDCRWNGHFAHDADLIDCTFEGKVENCVWFGEGHQERRIGAFASERVVRRNMIYGNNFSRATFVSVDWRFDFPVGDQTFPEGYEPPPEIVIPPDILG